MTTQMTANDLLNKKDEFVNYGSQLGLFQNEDTISSVISRLYGAIIKIDNSIDEDAIIKYDKGTPTITINVERCNNHGEDFYLDKVLFHKFAHVVNEIQREIHVYSDQGINRFKDICSEYNTGNDTIESPDRGLKVLDEFISEYTARAIVYRKYFMESNSKDNMEPTKYASPINPVFDSEENYNTFYLLSDKFSQTVFRAKDPLFRLCKESFDHSLLDSIFSCYRQRDNGNRELYEILGGMGNIFDIRKGIKETPDTESKSLKYVLERTEKISKN